MPRAGTLRGRGRSMTLREVRISNLAVVREAVLELEEGFSVLTGESGAGKSVCIGALRLALGGRADTDAIRPGADAARVAAVFDNIPGQLGERLGDLGVPEDDLLTLVREVPRSGRGVCRVNGAMVSLAVLREVGETLVEVTAQGASQRLLKRSWQRDLLDGAGGPAVGRLRTTVADRVRAWREADDALAGARRAASSGAAELARAHDLASDLAPLDLRPGEDAELATERLRLRHAARIVEAALALAAAAAGDDGGGADVLAAATGSAADAGSVDPALQELAGRAGHLVDELRELGLDAKRHADSVTLEQERQAAVEERLDVIARVVRRHGSIEQALDDLAGARRLLDAADGGSEGIARLEAAAEAARRGAGEAAARLSTARTAAARRLEQVVTTELRALGLPHARFRVVLTRAPDPAGVDTGDGIGVRCGPRGVDEVDFRFGAGRDSVPVPLDEGPSGGELSRVALALSAAAVEQGAPIFVLDEVDTGIGGETAARIGDALAGIGAARQVLAVTHRAEIAARATGHLLVSKRDTSAGAVARVDRVEAGARVAEIARLLSGRATEAATRRAEELLEDGRASHSDRSRPGAALRTI
ncbi:MAG TPA: DNA repair protein RecN [Candidatus Dormibacteraeota bacterium]